MGHQHQHELQMRGLTDTTLLDRLIGNLRRYHGILALNDREVVHLTQVEHLIHEFRNAFAVFYDLMIDRLQILTAELDIRGCQHLGETREHIQRCAHLVGDLLDELRFHPGRLFCLLLSYQEFAVGGIELMIGLATGDGVDAEEEYDEHKTDTNTHLTLMESSARCSAI